MDLTDFLLSIAASIVAGVLLIVITSATSKRFRWLIISILNRLIRGDIDDIYANAQEAAADLQEDLGRSRVVWIFTGRGSELSRNTFEPALHRKGGPPVEIRVLLPATQFPNGQTNWTALRMEEIAEFDASASTLGQHIEQVCATLVALKGTRDIEVRRFRVPHIGRMILTDRYVYFTPYEPDRHGKDSALYRFTRGGPFYHSLSRFMAQVWKASEPAIAAASGISQLEGPRDQEGPTSAREK